MTKPLIVLVDKGSQGHPYMDSDRRREFWQKLKDLCPILGFDIQCLGVSAKENPVLKMSQFPEARGFILIGRALKEIPTEFLRSPILKAVAVIDEGGVLSSCDTLRPQIPFCRFRYTTNLAGKETARELLFRGHKRIAFISATHELKWSRDRLSGLQEEYLKAGLTDGVISFTADESPEDKRIEDDARLAKFATQLASDPGWGQPYKAARKLFRHAEKRVRPLGWLPSLMEAALTRPDITAWVMANDNHAILALDFLKERGMAVPGRLAVCGFDDKPEAGRRALSSYRFDIQAIAEDALRFLEWAGSHPKPGYWIADCAGGRLVHRASTGEVPEMLRTRMHQVNQPFRV